MTLSFAPLLAEHPVYPGPNERICRCGIRLADEDDHRAHMEAVLLAEVARVLGSDEAVEVIGRGLLADYDSQYDTSHLEWTEFEDQARALLAALTTHLTGDTR